MTRSSPLAACLLLFALSNLSACQAPPKEHPQPTPQARPAARLSVKLSVSPFREDCFVPALRKAGAVVLGPTTSSWHGDHAYVVQAPGLEKDSSEREFSSDGLPGKPLPSTHLSWAADPRFESEGRVELDFHYHFGPDAKVRQEEVEAKLSALLGAMTSECGLTVSWSACDVEGLETTAIGELVDCLTLPRIDPPPRVDLRLPSERLPPPPAPTEAPTLPADYVPPNPYPDEWYGEQEQ